MPRRWATDVLSLLVAATALAGALLPWLLPSREGGDPWLLGILALLAAVSGLRCVKPSTRGAWFVPTDAFVLAAIVTVGGRAACAVAVAGVLATTLGVAGKLAFRRILFNVGTVVVATVAASAVFASLGGHILAFLGAATALFLVNTGLVAGAVSLDRARPWVGTWRTTFLPTLPRYLLAATLGAVLAGFASWGTGCLLVLGSLPGLSGTIAQTLTTAN
jgi:hypothetical protein